MESLEGRLVLNAALAPLPDISAPAFQGYQVVLDGSDSGATQQTFTVTSSNPDIKATVAQGQFLTMNVTHQSSGPGDPAFSGNIVFQLFESLTPNTAATIGRFVTSGFYNDKDLFRVANGFPDANGYIIQGGSPNNLDTGVSGLPGTPFPNEIIPQLAFTNPGQLGMANTGQPDSNDTQFFITTAAPSFLDGGYTIFGQVVSGLDLVNEMTQLALTSDPINPQFNSYPVDPIVVNTETLSSTNPNGVLHIDTTGAQPGETSTITVTADDPASNGLQTQSFMVTVGPSTVVGPPTANAQSLTAADATPELITLTGSDPDSPPLALTYNVTAGPTHGTLSGTAPNLTYTAEGGYIGSDSFQFTVSNGTLASAPATVALTVIGQPTASAQSVSTAEGTTTAITLTGSDPNTPPPLPLTYSIIAFPTHGELSGTAPNLIYTPDAGYVGSDSFQFTDTDVFATSTPATVAITVTPSTAVGQPTANGQSVITGQGSAKAITLSGSDPDSPPLALTYSVVAAPAHGTLSGTAPNLTYTPASGYFGPDSFEFTDSNGSETSGVANVLITVVGQPTANAQSVPTAQDRSTAITLGGSDPNSPPLALSFSVTANPSHGTLSGTAPNLTYTPASGYFGPDSFQFTASNGTATSAPAIVALTVVGQPTANSQSITTPEGPSRSIILTGTDPNTPPLTLTYTVTAAPAHGTLSGTAPNLTYTPDTGYFGPDSFQFIVTNVSFEEEVNSAPATVALTVVGQPTANAQSVTTTEGVSRAITLTGFDPNTPPFLLLSYEVTAGPAHGTLSGVAPNLVYTPDSGYSGSDSFQFTVTNTGSGTAVTSGRATVSVTISAQPPSAAPVTGDSLNGSALPIQLLGSSPASDQAISYAIVSLPTQGTISQFNPANGTLVYTPNAGAQGTDSFGYQVTNVGQPAPGLTSQPATITLELTAPVPVVTVKSVQWQVIKVHGKKPRTVLVVSFSGARDLGTAEKVNNYHLIAAGRDEKFGTRDDKNLKLQAPVYDASAHTVTLTPKGTVPNQTLKLTITDTQTTSAVGRPKNGLFFQLSTT